MSKFLNLFISGAVTGAIYSIVAAGRNAHHDLTNMSRLRHEAHGIAHAVECKYGNRQRAQRPIGQRGEDLVEHWAQQTTIGLRLGTEIVNIIVYVRPDLRHCFG